MFPKHQKEKPGCFSMHIISSFKPNTHRAAEAAAASMAVANGGLWWCLGMGPGPIFKRHHRPALAAAADVQCGYTLRKR